MIMFNKIFRSLPTNNGSVDLAFLRSSAVKTFPSGRRRSSEVGAGDDAYYIPFDPEARLNTEANNRKHSGLNGYTQTYLKEWEWNETSGHILLSLAGYLFDISLDPDTATTPTEVGELLAEKLEDNTNRIYANVIIEDIKLYTSGTGLEYYTGILRDQPNSGASDDFEGTPNNCLDLLCDEESSNREYITDINNYYFSGLSFSTTPLAEAIGPRRQVKRGNDSSNAAVYADQQIISLQLLEKSEGNAWQIYQPALLPRIEHGTTDDSIVVYGDTTVKTRTDRPTIFTVEGIAVVEGDTAIKSNLKVEDNIIVGAPNDPAEALGSDGGCIVAQNNITAEQDLIAKNNLIVKQNATISGDLEVTSAATLKSDAAVKKNLVVGDNFEDGYTNVITDEGAIIDEGTIIAKSGVKAPVVEATTKITTPEANITILNVKDSIEEQANIDKATINELTVLYGESAEGESMEGKEATTITKAGISTPYADIEHLAADTLIIDDAIQAPQIDADNLYQGGYNVPIIELNESNDGFYQLKISRINSKASAEPTLDPEPEN